MEEIDIVILLYHLLSCRKKLRSHKKEARKMLFFYDCVTFWVDGALQVVPQLMGFALMTLIAFSLLQVVPQLMGFALMTLIAFSLLFSFSAYVCYSLHTNHLFWVYFQNNEKK
jgi:hypothetical protein